MLGSLACRSNIGWQLSKHVTGAYESPLRSACASSGVVSLLVKTLEWCSRLWRIDTRISGWNLTLRLEVISNSSVIIAGCSKAALHSFMVESTIGNFRPYHLSIKIARLHNRAGRRCKALLPAPAKWKVDSCVLCWNPMLRLGNGSVR